MNEREEPGGQKKIKLIPGGGALVKISVWYFTIFLKKYKRVTKRRQITYVWPCNLP